MLKKELEQMKKIGPMLGMLLVFLAGLWLRYYNRDVLSGDMWGCLLPWYDEIAQMDLKTALITQVGNYNTLYQLMIFGMTKIKMEPMYAYKLLSVLFDVLLAAGGFAFMMRLGVHTQDKVDDISRWNMAALAASLIWISPITWMNSASWGQCDSMYVSCIVWAMVCLLDHKEIRAAILIGIAFAFKLQTIFILPFLFLYLCAQTKWLMRMAKCLIAVIAGFFACILPNILAGRPFSDSLQIYIGQTDTYHHMTMNYPGFWCFFPDQYDAYKIPAICLTSFVLLTFCLYCLWKRRIVTADNMLLLAFLTSMFCVWFLPSMHERYGYMCEIFLLLYCCQRKAGWVRLVLLFFITYRSYMWYLYELSYNNEFASTVIGLVLLSFVVEFVLPQDSQKKWEQKKELLFGEKKSESVRAKEWKLEGFDYGLMAVAVLGYFVLCLLGLGKNAAPETSQVFSKQDGAAEIILEFDEPVNFGSINLFLGHEGLKSASVSSYENEQWNVIDGEAKMNSAFCWNEVSLSYTSQYIGIVFLDDVTYVNELVCKNDRGEMILPRNADRYPNLFDEQTLCPNVSSYYEGTMFDEVYHGRTAYEFIHGLPIYENTHPPLGKSIIAIGIRLFGMNPFGWRIMCVLFGSFMMPFFYLAAYRITRERIYGALSLVFAATEFMHFTLSRIATIDVIVALFILAMFYFMYAFVETGKRGYLFPCGIASALAVSTKWTGIYALLGVAILFFVWLVLDCKKTGIKKETLPAYMKLAGICVVCFILIPLGIYTLSYLPFVKAYPDQNLISHVISNGQSMLSYHQNAVQEHPYSSVWYSWLVDYKPLVDSRAFINDSQVSVVATFGNPFLWIAGLAALCYECYLFLKKKNKISGGLVLFYLSMLLPWVFVKRTVFIYQYFVCSLLLIIMLCHVISEWKVKQKKWLIYACMGISVAFFVSFYPVISGMVVSKQYIREFLMWLPSWMFV